MLNSNNSNTVTISKMTPRLRPANGGGLARSAEGTDRTVRSNRIIFSLLAFTLVALCSFCVCEARSVDEPMSKLKFATNNPDVSIFSPHTISLGHNQHHHRRMHSPIINELVEGISSALTAVGGDEQAVPMVDHHHITVTSPPTSTTIAESTTNTSNIEGDGNNDSDDSDGDSVEAEEDECPGLFVTSGGSADDKPPSASLSAKRSMTDNEKLLALQTCLQKKVKRRLMKTARSSMELFEKLSLSGGCTSSLMNLMSALGETKSYAFKFLDASAKIPSGVMYGLLSDFGDFDQCLSIRSNPRISPEFEVEEGSFSGKYCLLNVRLNYHVDLGPNATAPEGIYEDGVLWDELVRNYWTSKSTKGFQVGVCVPSRCSNDDLEQLYKLIAESYNVIGEVLSCQDSNDLRGQTAPDSLQLVILYLFAILFVLNLIGTIVERYWPSTASLSRFRSHQSGPMIYRILICFSVRRNWALFMRTQDASTILAFNYDESPTDSTNQQRRFSQEHCFVGLVLRDDNLAKPSSISSTGTHNVPTPVSSSSFEDSTASDNGKREDSQADLVVNANKNENKETRPDKNDICNNVLREQNQVNPKHLLTVKISNQDTGIVKVSKSGLDDDCSIQQSAPDDALTHLTGFKLLVIIWITIGHSFLYPSANNYQYYRSIINMNITRDSVWFAATNFTLGIDMLLYITGLVFVYKLAHIRSEHFQMPLSEQKSNSLASLYNSAGQCNRISREFFKKILRFWPTYLTVIALAIVMPLIGDGPMWPEMVTRRLGDACRKNWWANLLVINNFFAQNDVCLPSSWFVSVLMQLFLIGSIIMLLVRKCSSILAMSIISLLLVSSSLISFLIAYYMDIKAPVIRMDESFVLELDDNIFRLYTNLVNNLGPFLVGMVGGFILVRWQFEQIRRSHNNRWQKMSNLTQPSRKESGHSESILQSIDHQSNPNGKDESGIRRYLTRLSFGLAVCIIAILVLSSVFHTNYTQFWSAVYWSGHRVGWAIVTGYVIHQCAIGRLRLLKDLFSLSHLIPFSRLIFIAYLVYPIFIHLHSGLVRDGLHVSIYNMLNIYVTRLVLTFTTALFIHLLVELPFCSIEALILKRWLSKRRNFDTSSHPSLVSSSAASSAPSSLPVEKTEPLLATQIISEPNK